MNHAVNLGLDNDPELIKNTVTGKEYTKIDNVDLNYLENLKLRNANKNSIERQNVDVTVHEGIEVQSPTRFILPDYKGVKKDDNTKLYHSLRRSYLKMGERPDEEAFINKRDPSPEDHIVNKEQFLKNK